MNNTLQSLSSIRSIISGVLLVFVVRIFIGFRETPILFGVGAIAVLLAYIVVKKTHVHFTQNHHHQGDSVIDSIPFWVVMIANIFHPAIDGFSFWEVFQNEGLIAGVIVGVGIVLHEIVRQSGLVLVLKQYGIKWFVIVSTALFGILIGVVGAITHADFFHTYEYVAEITALFAYGFIIFDGIHHKLTKKWPLPFGVLIGICLVLFLQHH